MVSFVASCAVCCLFLIEREKQDCQILNAKSCLDFFGIVEVLGLIVIYDPIRLLCEHKNQKSYGTVPIYDLQYNM